MSTVTKDLYDIGEAPPIGHVPPKMHAMTVRRENFGDPVSAFTPEVVSTPEVGPREVLVYVMAAGINYNNVWAALGVPVDVIKVHAQSGDDTGFHIGGSDGSGIVYAVGDEVTDVKVGDEVVIHCGSWDPEAPDVKAVEDPMFASSFRIWGY
ncbi:MAG: alcohol dehydrogenase catalytic domain-containing protein, partial [Dehalococcoidia bacterium]